MPNHSPEQQNFNFLTITGNNLFKFSAQESDLAPFVDNGTKVKIPSEIKPPLAFLHRKLDKNDVIFKYFNHNSISNICVVLFFRSSESSAWSSSSSSSGEEEDGPVGAGGSMAPSDFDRSVNPISTRGADYPHHITTGLPDFWTVRRL